ncbi:MAG TPA: VWA domain-containing protein [Polyangiaceae bacterium]|nr:VWA domain-containing protein [Polyangiaceae bacterium]
MRFAASIWLLGALGALAVGVVLVIGAILSQRAVRRFGEEKLVLELATARAGGRRALKGVLLVLSLALAFVALAQPQYGRGSRVIPATNLDVVLVLDYSKSMYARDIPPSRTERAKAEMARLINDLPGARFGTVAFAGETLSFPITSDGAAILQFLRQLTPNDMPVGGTAIARALEAGRELLARDPLSKDHKKVMVLVTDGEDLEGDPVQEAQAAAKDQITIYVDQIGGRTPEPIPDVNEYGQVKGWRSDDDGKPLTTELSAAGEEQLAKVAEVSGGLIARSEKGETGLESIAARLRHLMSEELSERVETVYADVFAYPLAFALLLLVIETFVPESRRRDRAVVPPLPPEQRRKRKKRAARAAASGIAAGLLLPLVVGGCEQANDLFLRNSPVVKDAVGALDAGDAGAAVSLLEEYLSTGKCENGNIGAPSTVGARPNAAFDLGLGLFAIAEKFGKRFGEDSPPPDGGRPPEEEAELAKRSAEVDCALRIVRLAATDPNVPLELRARAFYLIGNLEFLRREYKNAVAGYDAALKLIPGLPEDAGDSIGRDAAYNRSIALRRIEDQQKDAGPPDASPDGGEPKPDAGEDGGKQQPDAGEQKPDAGGEPDAGDQGKDKDKDKNKEPDGGANQPPDAGNPQGNDGGEQPPEQQQQPRPEPQTQNQDDRLLDDFEQAPTLQQHDAKQRAAHMRGRPSGKDDK